MNHNDNICAIATATGGAIAIVRVSGDDAITIVDKIFSSKGPGLSQRKAYTVAFGQIVDGKGEAVDDVLATVFRAPHSYTGENAVELSCHGSAYILQQVMQLLIANGCRQAERGEFTQRAFLNGKMDLSQAEAVADLIASSSAATHRMAMSQMRGDFSRRLSALRDKLLRLTSLMELELDFSDHEELEFADRTELKDIATDIEQVIGRLASSFALGNALKNGVPVAIVGDTNAGKSTLLNALVGEERAIVSDIHGTTRDVIEDTMNIDGTLFRFIDTAGIRDTHDKVESLGIERTYKKISEAQIVVWLIDATTKAPSSLASEKIGNLCQGKTLIVAHNKVDLAPLSTSDESSCCAHCHPHATHISISAKTGQGLPELKRLLADTVSPATNNADGIIVSNLRHYEALTQALEAIRRVLQGLSTDLPTDLVAQDLRDCLAALADITGGAITTQETLSNIFSHFCIGK